MQNMGLLTRWEIHFQPKLVIIRSHYDFESCWLSRIDLFEFPRRCTLEVILTLVLLVANLACTNVKKTEK